MLKNNKIIIVGGGPSGLFCAYLLLKEDYDVDLYDQSSGLAKKFLIAGNGGLNLTHSEQIDEFSKRYTHNETLFEDLITDFTPGDLRAFCLELGVETFVGTSGRVFPKKLKAGEILVNWSKELKAHPNFNLYLKHSLVDITQSKELTFINEEKTITAKGDIIIMATGGGSWKKTGSDGKWLELMDKLKIKTTALKPMNCGFEVSWSEILIKKLDRAHLKNINISFDNHTSRGEIMITPSGIEGGGIYALSNFIRDAITESGESVTITLDLKPDLNLNQVKEKLKNKKSKDSLANHLRKSLNLDKVAITLLNEVSRDITAEMIKSLPIKLNKTNPVDEAISTSGGVLFSELSPNLESIKVPGIYFAGEMLDFEAPTGGYLLQGCFSTAYRVVSGIIS